MATETVPAAVKRYISKELTEFSESVGEELNKVEAIARRKTSVVPTKVWLIMAVVGIIALVSAVYSGCNQRAVAKNQEKIEALQDSIDKRDTAINRLYQHLITQELSIREAVEDEQEAKKERIRVVADADKNRAITKKYTDETKKKTAENVNNVSVLDSILADLYRQRAGH